MKEDSHEDKSVQDRSRSTINRNTIKYMEEKGEVEQGIPKMEQCVKAAKVQPRI